MPFIKLQLKEEMGVNVNMPMLPSLHLCEPLHEWPFRRTFQVGGHSGVGLVSSTSSFAYLLMSQKDLA